MSDEAVVLQGAGIAFWVFTSRMYQLAWEIKHPGTHAPGTRGRAILPAMRKEGFIDDTFSTQGTVRNKLLVLRAMVDKAHELRSDWEPSSIIREALDTCP